MKIFIFIAFLIFTVQMHANLAIEEIEWLENDRVLAFSGKTSLPPKTKLKIEFFFDTQLAAVRFIYVEDYLFNGYFGPFTQDLHIGKYELHVTAVVRQNSKTKQSMKKNFPFQYGKSTTISTALKHHTQNTIEKLFSYRCIYDDLLLRGHLYLWRAKESKDKKQFFTEWQKVIGTFPNFSKDIEQLTKDRNQYVIHPLDNAMKELIIFLDYFKQLKYAMNSIIATECGVVIGETQSISLSPFLLSQHIQRKAKKILQILNAESYWGFFQSSPKEIISLDRKNKICTSRTSKFTFHYSSEPERIIEGTENSPLKLELVFEMINLPTFIIQIQQLKFSDYKTVPEKVNGWELLAQYEWENYQKISSENLNINEKNVYELVFFSHNKTRAREIKCYLYFDENQPEIVYCVMYINLLGTDLGHHSPQKQIENLEKIIQTFRVLK